MTRLVKFDTQTGNTQVLFEESSETHINFLVSDYLTQPAHRILASSNELIWWSERSGWGHLYLYDLTSGELKKSLTSGAWMVREVIHVDEEQREILIQTGGRIAGRDPYYRDICRVNIDTGVFTEVFSWDGDIAIHYPENWVTHCENNTRRAMTQARGVSPSIEHIVITRSRVNQAPITEVLDRHGKTLLEVEAANVSSLPTAWTWPEPVEVLAADGTTPLYGVLYRPSNFSPDKRYPVINHISAAPWQSMVPKGSFHSTRSNYTDMHYFHGAALAELGFIVLQLDSRGTPLRSKSFQDESYGWAPSACNSDDHAGAIQQLAMRYPSLDLDRVGSFTIGYHCGLIHYLQCQDLYKVHVQGSLLDNRFLASAILGDKYEGCDGPVDRENAEDLVEKLYGKLLLMHPVQDPMSACYPPVATLRVVNALQKANKDFDMLMVSGANSSYGAYTTRKTFDYLVKHLLGEEPPKEFEMEASFI